MKQSKKPIENKGMPRDNRKLGLGLRGMPRDKNQPRGVK